RRFSRKADLAQHYNQLHPYLKHSYTSNWIQNQQQLNSVPQTPQFSISNNIWNEIGDLGDFLQAKINRDYDKREVDDNSDKSEGISNENVDGGSNENVDNETDSGTDTNVENNGNNRINKSMKGNEVDSDDDERFKWINNNENEDFYRVGLNDAYEDLCNNKIDVIETLWPSEVYKEFMTAVTQHRLSDAAADSMLRIIRKYCTEPLPGSTRKGRMYMDQMDIKDFNIKMKDMVEFEGKIYKLQYRPIIDAIKSLVSNPDLSKNFLFDYKEQWEHDDNGNLVRVYSEQNSANWWRSTIFRQMQRKLEQRSFEYLLSPLLQKNGIYLAINGRIEHFTLHLSAILADMSEAQNICCTYKSYRTQCLCYKCLTPGDQLNNMNIEQNSIVLRDNNNMREAILSNNATECSIYEYNNFFWKFQTNIYDATAMDRMHLQEIGRELMMIVVPAVVSEPVKVVAVSSS
ncbi:16621_t:CDS:2, partial [Rhizophagus irregularis]